MRFPQGVPGVHKTLGIAVLVHIAYRMLVGVGRWGRTERELGVRSANPEGPAMLAEGFWTAPLLLHTLLAASSFIFRVPRKSTVEHVIDELYRAQVLAFTLRSVLVILIVVYKPPCAMLLRFAAVVSCHVGADAAQRSATQRSTTHQSSSRPGEASSVGVRRPLGEAELTRDGLQRWMVAPGRFFFAVAQLNATSQLLFVEQRDYVILGAFYTMAVIQVTAFLMTLRKKGLLPPAKWKWLYGTMLASVAVSMVRSVSLPELLHIIAVSLVFLVCRFGAGVGKYYGMAAVSAYGIIYHGRF